MNTLYYGDNLKILRKYIPDESVDLIYLDPPFNSKRAYNVIFKDKTGRDASAQIQAFEDTWHWNEETEEAFREIIFRPEYPADLKQMMQAFRAFMRTSFGRENDMLAYLTMMAIRLVELHRVLKPTGSIYLHCDPTASHYLKILMDQIFGVKNFRNEIVWKRATMSGGKSRAKQYGRNHDIVLFYSKSSNNKFNRIYLPYSDDYIKKKFIYKEPDGRVYRLQPKGTRTNESIEKLRKEGRVVESKTGYIQIKFYLNDMPGVAVDDVWIDVKDIRTTQKESLGYPTQKPLALLERIIKASSNEGDVVMDPFCGCGTAVVAAEKLGRKWIGIDITHLAISLIKKRLLDHFPDVKFQVIGEPESVEAAKALAEQSKFQFEAWAVSLLGGQPYKSKGGGDRGVDGLLYFMDFEGKFHRIIIQVKGGHYTLESVQRLKATMDTEGAPLGVLIALKKPTKGMLSYAASLGKWKMPGSQKEYPVMQILTIEDYFNGVRPDLPDTSATLKKAKREIRESEKPQELKFDS